MGKKRGKTEQKSEACLYHMEDASVTAVSWDSISLSRDLYLDIGQKYL